MKPNNGLAGSLVVLIQYRDKSYTAYAISSIRMQSTASSARAEYINSSEANANDQWRLLFLVNCAQLCFAAVRALKAGSVEDPFVTAGRFFDTFSDFFGIKFE